MWERIAQKQNRIKRRQLIYIWSRCVEAQLRRGTCRYVVIDNRNSRRVGAAQEVSGTRIRQRNVNGFVAFDEQIVVDGNCECLYRFTGREGKCACGCDVI